MRAGGKPATTTPATTSEPNTASGITLGSPFTQASRRLTASSKLKSGRSGVRPAAASSPGRRVRSSADGVKIRGRVVRVDPEVRSALSAGLRARGRLAVAQTGHTRGGNCPAGALVLIAGLWFKHD